MKKLLCALLALILLFGAAFAEILVDGGTVVWDVPSEGGETLLYTIEYGESYTSPEDVSMYLHVFRELPENYITKREARSLGWDAASGNLHDVAPGKSIGGDPFGNREGILPDGTWYECDVNYSGGYRGSERLLFSEDGMIYVTYDHYETATQLFDGWYEGEYDG